jgi:hypothetical protein
VTRAVGWLLVALVLAGLGWAWFLSYDPGHAEGPYRRRETWIARQR